MNKEERKLIISTLQELAQSVLELKSTHRQKRPIIIEFCGSPKAGKTSCINSLELFLKRNGFTVEIVQERANVCPVADKRSPMFNIWTSCMSIANMIGVLERKESSCDVLILDRGVFDAFCWFNWLSKKKMFDNQQRMIVENFLSMDLLINRIDIVFVFTAKPIVSIKREYANLLTNKPGSIMNRKVLQEYLYSIEETIEMKQNIFHNVLKIDTSEKNQDEVGKEVTESILNTLQDALMERVGYFVPSAEQRIMLEGKQIFKFPELYDVFSNIQFDLRYKVEDNDNYLQPIPIAVLTNEKMDSVLVVKKTSKAAEEGSPERNKTLIYVGGHSRKEDYTEATQKDFLAICRYTLRREIKEELGISLALDNSEPFVIYTPDSPKSKKHIAICFVIKIDNDSLKLRLDSEELISSRGNGKSGKFYPIKSLGTEIRNMESWSIAILRTIFIEGEQMSLF